jgi:hypothetical protein
MAIEDEDELLGDESPLEGDFVKVDDDLLLSSDEPLDVEGPALAPS